METTYKSTREAARYIGVTQRCLENWRRDGFGPRFVKAGRRVLYSVEALEIFMRQNTFKSIVDASASSDRAT